MDSPRDTPAWNRDFTFWSFVATQFLGAFNDNLYKQLLLLLFVAVPVTVDGQVEHRDYQWVGLLLFSLPFILFSGFAGFLSERYSKSRAIYWCKVAEIAIMLLGVVGFLIHARLGISPAMVWMLGSVLFLMAAQSAFFGPAKYGSLPEFFATRDLPQVNGAVLMTTFLAIIFGTGLAGPLMDWWGDRLWMSSLLCVAIAALGTFTAWLIRPVSAALPGLPFAADMLFIPRDIFRLIREDRALYRALVVSTVFWLTAAIVQPAVNALGKIQLKLDNTQTSLMVTIISAGIAGGSVLAGYMSRGRVDARVQRIGSIGMVVTLLLLAVPYGPRQHLLGYQGSLVALVLLGMFTGMFAVPLNVFLQSRPPDGLKGRTIATQNLLNWVGIFAAAGIYPSGAWLLSQLNWPGNGMFALTALLMMPIAFSRRRRDD